MNIVMREIWANKKALLIWSGSMIIFVIMMFVEFSAYYKNPEILALIETFPKEMLEAFDMYGANLTTVSGYMGVAAVFINLALGIYAVLLGNSIIAKEERDKTAGFLMTLPVTRARVITGKLIASAICCAILLMLVFAGILISIIPFEVEDEFPAFLSLLMLTTYAIMLIFLGIGMTLAAFIRRYKISSGLGVGLIFGLYLLSIIVELSEDMEFLKYLTPFKYFESAHLLQNLSIEPIYGVLSAIIIVVTIASTYIAYTKRDIYI